MAIEIINDFFTYGENRFLNTKIENLDCFFHFDNSIITQSEIDYYLNRISSVLKLFGPDAYKIIELYNGITVDKETKVVDFGKWYDYRFSSYNFSLLSRGFDLKFIIEPEATRIFSFHCYHDTPNIMYVSFQYIESDRNDREYTEAGRSWCHIDWMYSDIHFVDSGEINTEKSVNTLEWIDENLKSVLSGERREKDIKNPCFIDRA